MNYSIIIPVFNKAALTRHCLETLPPTLLGAGDGEVIVIDNASSDETPEMLKAFPWVRMVRNERNLGFAGANNQGAQLARGRYLVLLNNDTEARPGWLAAMLRHLDQGAGAVGARLLFPDSTIQHAGVVITPQRYGRAGFVPYHDLYKAPWDAKAVKVRRDLQVVTGACLATPRDLYLRLGGLDEAFWNGYEDVDYSLKVHAEGLRVVYEPDAVLTHFESQSGVQRFRRVAWNVEALASRWNGRVTFDAQSENIKRGHIVRFVRRSQGVGVAETMSTPKSRILCYGDAERGNDRRFLNALSANTAPIESIVFADRAQAVEAARREMEVRGDRYLALVDTRCELQPGWLDELVRQVEWSPGTAASAYIPELPAREDGAVFAADARCTLLALSKFPQHERLNDRFSSLGGAVADLLVRAVARGAGTRAAARDLVRAPALEPDEAFTREHGFALSAILDSSAEIVERALSAHAGHARRGLVSIVMLSWNAPEYTKLALESIREHTAGEYEVIVVDNGSRSETVEWLKTLSGVHVIYNASNRGYAGGNNQGIAAANGDYVVLLNNDVIVTDGWLDGLLGAFERIPGLGVSAPRSNIIAGDQVLQNVPYADTEQMHAFAQERRERYRDRGYMTDRAIGLCLCVDRRVIEEVGGIDERFGVGNFEDDDFCMRVRAAGYRIYVCDDVFIHHFGSKTFAANNVDWTATMQDNWKKFCAKWEIPFKQLGGGYRPGPLIRGGFNRQKHYVPLPVRREGHGSGEDEPKRAYRLAFTIAVRDEREWDLAGAFTRRYLRAFTAEQPVLYAIAALGDMSAEVLGERVKRIARKEDQAFDRVADIEVSDEEDLASWHERLSVPVTLCVTDLADPSPSGLRRYLEREAVS